MLRGGTHVKYEVLCFSRSRAGGQLLCAQLSGTRKRAERERSWWRRRMASERRGAMESTRSLEDLARFSSWGMLSVTHTSWRTESLILSTAGPERRPCVARAYTSLAPSSISREAAFVRVPAVSIMSSTITHVLPSTSPTSCISDTWLAACLRLRMVTMLLLPMRSATRLARVTPPASGDTIVRFSMSKFLSWRYLTNWFSANRLSTGMWWKKPWI
mmetsp:Transcript_10693/g.43828  ORF Transcript_10693/g.43828 Transcript_10693/m.43828 type:complete len:216 (+) Transcript_10693:1575-2222(+)